MCCVYTHNYYPCYFKNKTRIQAIQDQMVRVYVTKSKTHLLFSPFKNLTPEMVILLVFLFHICEHSDGTLFYKANYIMHYFLYFPFCFLIVNWKKCQYRHAYFYLKMTAKYLSLHNYIVFIWKGMRYILEILVLLIKSYVADIYKNSPKSRHNNTHL